MAVYKHRVQLVDYIRSVPAEETNFPDSPCIAVKINY